MSLKEIDLDKSTSQPYIEQKNSILLERFESNLNGNITDLALQYVNFCDESFNIYLNNTDRRRLDIENNKEESWTYDPTMDILL